MLKSTEYEIYHAHKCSNANNYWHLKNYKHDKYSILEFESKKSLIFQYCSFHEQLKFHAQLS